MGTIHTYEVLLNRLRNGEATAVFDIQVCLFGVRACAS